MHEMSLAVSLIERVQAEAAKGGLSRVSRVSLEVGSLQSVEPELLQEAFSVVAEGTLAEGAVLEMEVREAQALCHACGSKFEPAYFHYACPACGKADAEILGGRDLFLRSLSGEESLEAGHV